eukprot:scaffold73529_cov82-Phaeocystis_antarctica.AAC.5
MLGLAAVGRAVALVPRHAAAAAAAPRHVARRVGRARTAVVSTAAASMSTAQQPHWPVRRHRQNAARSTTCLPGVASSDQGASCAVVMYIVETKDGPRTAKHTGHKSMAECTHRALRRRWQQT